MAQPIPKPKNPNLAKKAPVALIMDRLNIEMELAMELQKTLRSMLSPVLNQQPREDDEGRVAVPIVSGSSNLFNDLDQLVTRLAGLNSGYEQLQRDIEL